MDDAAVITVIVGLILVGGVALYVLRHTRLQPAFGPDDKRPARRAVRAHRADRWFDAGTRWASSFHIRPLSEDENAKYLFAWRQVQSLFASDPAAAVREADVLATNLMASRGYPMTDFERRARDLSVEHPAVVSHYRNAHQVVGRYLTATTDEIRQALMDFRALFDDLLEA